MMANEGKTLFVVEVETEIVVLAKDRLDAEKIARGVRDPGEPTYFAQPMRYMPAEWDAECLVYGPEGDHKLGDLIAAGHAPEYKVPR